MTAQLIPDRPAPARPRRPKRQYGASFIYDVPGPRGRRNILIGSIVSVVVFAMIVGLGLWQFAAHGQLAVERWAPFTEWAIWQYLLVGLLGTLEAAAIVAVLGAAFGTVLALGRVSQVRWIRFICGLYIEIARTVPVLLVIYLMLFGLPQIGINLPTLWKLVVPLTIANAAVFAEIIRAGILSLPRGQREAALSLGMRPVQAMTYVVLPQAVRNVTPSLVTQFVSLLKDTSLGYIVAFTELLYRGQVLASYLHLLIPTYVAVTVIYLIVNGSLSAFASRLQRGSRRRTSPQPVLPTLPAVVAVEHVDDGTDSTKADHV
ncbi:amino acid ABC transporter permease [Leifsonia sp. 1010]|uniref:amino acid ABC transporter permease n=1 Tax=Leifsonia sp. 1010 TaxID=2817769 RepID=UPI0028631583|nr:amino acid ABC transporter permease [Leifsonia sp. 1010]MDR6611856.1 glutamate transport system permease protein [Leifsonia sp. 1010]